jgi:RNA methyltransferase, TrmH family
VSSAYFQSYPPASKSLLKQIRSLQLTKFRNEHGLFVAEGVKIVRELLQSDLTIKAVVGTEEIIRKFSEEFHSVAYFTVKHAELKQASGMKTPNQVLAIAQIPVYETQDIPDRHILVLDGISDPGNMGTLIRTAEWFGISDIYCSDKSTDCWAPKTVQSAMGSLFRMNIVYTDLPELLSGVNQKRSHRVIGASLHGGEFVSDQSAKYILVIGSESHGISEKLSGLISELVIIPRKGRPETESLNAAVAAGILLHEITRP